jgi:hypothetical protein
MIDIKKYLHFGFGLKDFLTLDEFKGRKDIVIQNLFIRAREASFDNYAMAVVLIRILALQQATGEDYS